MYKVHNIYPQSIVHFDEDNMWHKEYNSDMKWIKLNKGRVAIVDDDQYDELNKYKWFATGDGYAARRITKDNGKEGSVRMHRQITNQWNYNGEIVVDHINRDKCDNRKSNLRLVTHAENAENRVYIKPRHR